MLGRRLDIAKAQRIFIRPGTSHTCSSLSFVSNCVKELRKRWAVASGSRACVTSLQCRHLQLKTVQKHLVRCTQCKFTAFERKAGTGGSQQAVVIPIIHLHTRFRAYPTLHPFPFIWPNELPGVFVF
jgi:hypothetical protein